MTPPSPTSNDAPPPPLPGLLDRRALNLPNAITVSRFVLAMVLFVLIWMAGWWRIAAVLFVAAAFTDFLDGYLARKYGQVTVLGRILDPFVDKLIICGAFIFLQDRSENGLSSGVNAWMTFVIIAREMFITSLRAMLEQHGKDFSAAWTGKAKMCLQSATVPIVLLSLSRTFLDDISGSISVGQFQSLRDMLLWATVGVTLYSGVEYVIRALRIWRQG